MVSTNLKLWGSTGSEPPDGYNYVEGEQPVDEWDNWFNSNVVDDIQDLIDAVNAIDSNGDGTVDAAETAAAVKGNDIDSDGDGVVDAADDTTTVKGNDIDFNGDGVVDKADSGAAGFSFDGNVNIKNGNIQGDGVDLLFNSGRSSSSGDVTVSSGDLISTFAVVRDKFAAVTDSSIVTDKWQNDGTVEWEAEVGPSTDAHLLYQNSSGTNTLKLNQDNSVEVPNGSLETKDYKENHETRHSWGDISTGSVNNSLDVDTDVAVIGDTSWGNGGSSFYILDPGNNVVAEYSVSTAYDITSASLSQTFDISTETSSADALLFANGGAKMYVSEGATVYEYDLSTAYDVSTATLNQSNTLSNVDGEISGLDMSSDGSKAIIVDGTSTESINEYALSTAYDINTASFVGDHPIDSVESTPTGLWLSSDGKRAYVSGHGGIASVHEFALHKANTVSDVEHLYSLTVDTSLSQPTGISWDGPGSKLYFGGLNDVSENVVYEWTVDYTHEVDLSIANVHKVTVQDDVTFSFKGIEQTMGNSATLRIVQDSTGGHSVSFSNARWPGGSAPSWSTSANALDIASFAYDPDSGTWDDFPGGMGMQ